MSLCFFLRAEESKIKSKIKSFAATAGTQESKK
jgi:hypothetical protein